MSATQPHIWVFFYGTFMNRDVLIDHGVTPASLAPARLNGFELNVRPRVNLSPSDQTCAYGAIAAVTHEDLSRLYSDLEKVFGVKYSAQPVLADTLDGFFKPVLCFIAQHMIESPPAREYVTHLAECVRAAGLPEWYANFVESFGPKEEGSSEQGKNQ